MSGKFQIKHKGNYMSLNLGNGKYTFSDSPDMGYIYSKEDAEAMADRMADEGYLVEVVEYNHDWWKTVDEMNRDKMSKGGRIRSKAALAKDRKYTSDEPHELAYRFKRKTKVMRYNTKMEQGGSVSTKIAELESNIEKLKKVQKSDLVPQSVKDKASLRVVEMETELAALKAEKSVVKEVKKVEKKVAEKKAPEKKVKAKLKSPEKRDAVNKGKRELSKMSQAHKLAKQIRKEGEGYNEALKRAFVQLKDGKTTSTTKKKIVSKRRIAKAKAAEKPTKKKITSKRRALKSTNQNELGKKLDAQRQALPAGKRISANGVAYYESRENRADKYQPTKKTITSKRRKKLL